MSAPKKPPLFAERELRLLLWLCCATVCWWWVLALRAPLPDEFAVGVLWHAGRWPDDGAGFTFVFPASTLVLAVVGWCGAELEAAQQVIACVAGGLLVAGSACLAQRLRRGAGLPAAFVTCSLPWVAAPSAAGAPVAMALLLFASAAFCVGPWGWLPASLLILGGMVESGIHVPFALPLLAAPALIGLLLSWLTHRLRNVLALAIVAVCGWQAWHAVEPPVVWIERAVGELVAERLADGQCVVTQWPRVAYYAGQLPPMPRESGMTARQFGDLLAAAETGAAVVSPWLAEFVEKFLPDDYDRLELSPDLADQARAYGMVVFLRQRPGPTGPK